jgi:flagellar protein FliS
MMHASSRTGSRVYANTAVETGVSGASPEQLILMLYSGAIEAITAARHQLIGGQIADKGRSIGRAVAIIGEGLEPALDVEAGGEIAANLQALYRYMTARLTIANLYNDLAALDEVAALLRELRGAWEQIAARRVAGADAPRAAAVAGTPVSYGAV